LISLSKNNDISSNLVSTHLVFISIFVGILNVQFSQNYIVSLFLVIFEFFFLMFLLLMRRPILSIGYYLIFISMSFEFDALIGTTSFYGFKNFRVFGINIALITLMVYFLYYVLLFRNISLRKIKDYPVFFKYIKRFLLLLIVAISTSLFTLLVNDNNVMIEGVGLNYIASNIYLLAFVPFIIIFIISGMLINDHDQFRMLGKFFMAIFIGISVASIYSYLIGSYGVYGGLETLLLPVTIVFVPFLPLFYKGINKKLYIYLLWFISSFLLIVYNSSGKLLFGYIFTLIFIVFSLLYKRKFKIILGFSAFIIFIYVVINLYPISFLSDSIIYNIKLNQLSSMISFWRNDWLIDMPLSPKIRLIELYSIFIEFINKPWFFIFGKGYAGTFQDATGIIDGQFLSASYSYNEWLLGYYNNVHETFNILFLYSGIFGLLFFIYNIFLLFKNRYDPWITTGIFWFLLFYGYSFTLSIFGLFILMYGLVMKNYIIAQNSAKHKGIKA